MTVLIDLFDAGRTILRSGMKRDCPLCRTRSQGRNFWSIWMCPACRAKLRYGGRWGAAIQFGSAIFLGLTMMFAPPWLGPESVLLLASLVIIGGIIFCLVPTIIVDPHPHCLACGYDMSGSAGVCPECGADPRNSGAAPP
jgi:hypothetical protein